MLVLVTTSSSSSITNTNIVNVGVGDGGGGGGGGGGGVVVVVVVVVVVMYEVLKFCLGRASLLYASALVANELDLSVWSVEIEDFFASFLWNSKTFRSSDGERPPQTEINTNTVKTLYLANKPFRRLVYRRIMPKAESLSEK